MSREPKTLLTTPFVSLLPASISGDARIQAAAAALDAVQPATARGIPNLLIWARLLGARPDDLLPPLRRLAAASQGSGGLAPLTEPELDLLAWQLHVDGYETARNPEQKRLMVLESIALHRKKGTPWAVERAVGILLERTAQVREWFEYGGRPYFFRVRFDVTEAGFDVPTLTDVLRQIVEWKNVRSWLDLIETTATLPLPARYGLAVTGHSRTRVTFWMPPVPAPAFGVGARLAVVTRIAPAVQGVSHAA